MMMTQRENMVDLDWEVKREEKPIFSRSGRGFSRNKALFLKRNYEGEQWVVGRSNADETIKA
jgi:hypothetical protein